MLTPRTNEEYRQLQHDSWHANGLRWAAARRAGHISSRAVTDQAMREAIRLQSYTHALDLGCGDGWLTRELARGDHVALGLDSCPALIEEAQSQASKATFACVDYQMLCAAPLQLGSHPWDLITIQFALLDDDAQTGALLQALATIAAPGARLLIQTLDPDLQEDPDREGWRWETFSTLPRRPWEDPYAPMPWYHRTLGSWEKLFPPAWRMTRQATINPEAGHSIAVLFTAVRR